MNRFNQDRSFVERLERYDSPVADDMFSRLDIHREPNRRFFGYYFLMSALALVLITSFITYYYISKDKKNTFITTTETQSHTPTSISATTSSGLSQQFNLKSQGTHNFHNINEFTSSETQAYTATQQSITSSNDVIIHDRNIRNRSMEANSSLTPVENSIHSDNLSSGYVSTEEINNSDTYNKSQGRVAINTQDNTPSSKSVQPTLSLNSMRNSNEIDQLSILLLDEIEYGEEFGPTCPKVNKVKDFKYQLSLSAGMLLNHRVMKANSGSAEPINFIKFREESETILPTYELEAMIRVAHRSGLSVSSGLSYQLNEEKFSYISSRERTTSVKEVYDSQGNIIRRDTVIETGYREKTTYNRLQLVSVPIIAGYQVWVGDVYIRPELGASVGIAVHKKGEILDENHDFYSLNDDPKEYFDRSVFVQGIGKVSIGYLFKNDMTIELSPQYKYTITPLNGRKSPADQFYHRMGIQAGLSIPLKLNNKYKK